jgi:hypothetical protein
VEEWDLAAFMHVAVPTPRAIRKMANGERPTPGSTERGGDWEHYRIPRAWEYGAITRMVELQVEAILNAHAGRERPAHQMSYIEEARLVLMNQLRLDFWPAALKPMVEVWVANKNMFTGRPIVSEDLAELPIWAQSRHGTPILLRNLGLATRNLPEALQFSPVRADALIRGVFHTWGAYALMALDQAIYHDAPDLAVQDYPGLRTFLARDSSINNRTVREFFELAAQASEVQRAHRKMEQLHRPDIQRELERSNMAKIAPMMGRARRAITEINGFVTRISSAPTLLLLQEDVKNLDGFLSERLVDKYQKLGAWQDFGKLKRLAVDDLARFRNDRMQEALTASEQMLDD